MNRSDDVRGQAFTGAFDAATTRILPSARVTHVHVLRHGEVAEFTRRVVRGQLDVPLSPRGEEESALLAEWFSANEPRPDVVYTSDLVRCRVLGEDVARRTGCELVVDARLREQHMGAWEGRTWAEITAEEPAAVTAYWADYQRSRPTHGESFADLENRVASWWRDVETAHAGRRIVVATHIGVIRALVCRWLGVPGDQALRFAPATASHTAVTLGDAGAVVAQFGERPWAFAGEVRARDTASDANSALRPSPPNAPSSPRRPRAASGPTEIAPPMVSRPPHSLHGSRRPRIALSGSAGTGKTTLGRRLASELGVPFLDEIMRKRIEAGFDFHGMSRDDWRALMSAQWQEQCALEDAAVDGFVADRSSLDYAAFFLHYDLHVDGDARDWIERMSRASMRYDHVLVFPWGALPLVADGVRSTNAWTQLRFQTILEGLVDRYARTDVLRVPPTSDLEARVQWALSRVTSGLSAL